MPEPGGPLKSAHNMTQRQLLPRLLIRRDTNARLENLVIYRPCQFQYPVMVTPVYIPLSVINAVENKFDVRVCAQASTQHTG